MIEFTKQDFDFMFPDGKADYATISNNIDLLEEIAKQEGKSGVMFKEYASGEWGNTFQMFDETIPVKTKSQLKNIWDK